MADDDQEREKEIDITLVQGDNHMWHPNVCTLELASYSLLLSSYNYINYTEPLKIGRILFHVW